MPSIEINNGKVFINGKEISQHCSTCDQAKDLEPCSKSKPGKENKFICLIQAICLISWIYLLCFTDVQHPYLGTFLVASFMYGIEECASFCWSK